jgi:hypothetical protein
MIIEEMYKTLRNKVMKKNAHSAIVGCESLRHGREVFCRLTEEVKAFDKQRLAFYQKRSSPFEEKGQSFYQKGAVLLGKRSSPFRERIKTVLSCRDLLNCQTAENANFYIRSKLCAPCETHCVLCGKKSGNDV